MAKKKVMLFIVEGPTDETSLSTVLNRIFSYIKLNPSEECLPSDSRTYFKENGFRYTDGQKKKLLKTVSGRLTDYMSDWHRENLNKNEFRADH